MKKSVILSFLAAATLCASATPPARKLQAARTDAPGLTATLKLPALQESAKAMRMAGWPVSKAKAHKPNPFAKAKRTVNYRHPAPSVPGPWKASSSLPANAIITYSDDWTQETAAIGLYEVPTSGTPTAFEPLFLSEDMQCNGGAVMYDGKMLCIYQADIFGMIFSMFSEIDIETGETVNSGMPDIDWTAWGLVYDSTDNRIYGSFGSYTAGTTSFGILDPVTFSVTTIQEYSDGTFFTALGIDEAGTLYGMDQDGGFYRINKATGNATLVKNTGIASQYITTGTLDKRTGKFFYATSMDEGSAMYAIDPTTGDASKLYDITLNYQLSGMFMPVPKAADKAPAAVENLTVTFANESLSGNVSFKLPSTLFDGTEASGEFGYSITANDQEIASGTGTPGSDVNESVTLSAPGHYTITVCATNNAGNGPVSRKSIYAGPDTPTAVTNLTLTYSNGTSTLSWDAATGVNNGDLDPAALNYKITRYPDATVVAEAHHGTTFTEQYTVPDNTMEAIHYTVEANYKGAVSEPTESNKAIIGNTTAPYKCGFDNEDDFAFYTVVDNNLDGSTWKANTNCFRYSYSEDNPGNDYLILPGIRLEGGKTHILTFDAWCQGERFPERIAAYVGTAPTVAAMTTCLVEPTIITADATAPAQFSCEFKPAADGVYYFALKACSDADSYYLYADNIAVTAGIDSQAPGAPTNLIATPDASGALKATITFKAPAKDFDGNPLTSLDKVEILRGSELVTTLNPAIGADDSWTDDNAPAGNVTYTVVGYNASGRGREASVSVFIGFDLPTAPTALRSSMGENDGQVVLEWDAVTSDVKGNTLPAGTVTYTIVKVEDNNSLTPVIENLNDLTYTIQACAADAEQQFVQYGLFAVNSAGSSDGIGSDLMAVGAPYQLPFAESFANAGLSHIFGLGEGNAELSLVDDTRYEDLSSADGDNGYITVTSNQASSIELFSGRIDLGSITAPEMNFQYFCITPEDQNTIEVLIDAGEGFQKVTDIHTGVGSAMTWARAVVPLTKYAGKKISFMLKCNLISHAIMAIDDINIDSALGKNLAAGNLTAPTAVNAGEDIELSLEVNNFGTEAAAAYSVDFFCGATKFATVDGMNLDSGASAPVKAVYPTNPTTDKSLTFHAVVNFTGDERVSDNSSKDVKVRVTIPTHPAPTSLEATRSESNVNLSWTAPDLTPGASKRATEDFEGCEPFAIGEAAGWTFLDLDQKGVGGVQGIELPNITVQQPASFFVLDSSLSTLNETFAAASGTKCLAALFNYDGSKNDDWAISPELSGEAQEITFKARSYSSEYPDAFEVLYSTGSTNPEDFVSIAVVDAVPGEWTDYTYNLPAGAKRFAIRFMAEDTFMLMIDDVTMTTGAPDYSDYNIEGYNVYFNGVKLNEQPVTGTTFTHNDVPEGNHTYHVTAVYTAKGESAPSNAATVSVSGLEEILAGGISVKAVDGAIVVNAPADTAVSVADMSGRLIHTGTGSCRVRVARGVYAVKAGTKAMKIMVK